MSKFKVGDKVLHDVSREESVIIAQHHDHGYWCVRRKDGVWGMVHENHLVKVEPVDDTSEPTPDGTVTVNDPGTITLDHPNKYARTIYPLQGEPVVIDVYRVLDAYNVTDQAVAQRVRFRTWKRRRFRSSRRLS